MNILIPVETSSRELLYKTYLAHLLAMQGFDCFVGSKSRINVLMHRFKNYIYFDKGYHKGKSEGIYKIVKSRNGFIISLDEEGAVDYSDNRTLLKRYSRQLFDLVDIVFLWGEKQKEIINPTDIMNSKIIVSGHPRFELLKPEFQVFYNEEAKCFKKKYGKFILINTNMGFGNNIKGNEFVREGYGKWYNQIDEIIDYDKIKLDAYITFIKQLSESYNGNIIIRPHPEEDASIYDKQLDNLKNVIVINKGSVVPWIIASELMIHPDCTTSIESFFLGKKPISFLPKSNNTSHITKLPLIISSCINDFKDFEHTLNNNTVDTNNLKVINEYFSYDKDSSNIIANEICNYASKLQKLPYLPMTLSDRIYLNMKGLSRKLNMKKSKHLSISKLSGFTKVEVLRISNRFIEYNNKFRCVKISTIADKLFCFSKH
ncbi:hypothetical protein EB822_10725 [Flavobacteriaceae bacterium PRS1]|nr:hypothetical protein EB822_10725 [Flavobacteriaceae bacterium PRS1]